MFNNDDLTIEERENVPLLHHLQKLYDTHAQDEQDLHAIREQLLQPSQRPAVSLSEEKAVPREVDDARWNRGLRETRQHMRWSLPLNAFAALLVMTLLTGSFVTVLRLIRSSSTTPASLNTPGTVSTPCTQWNTQYTLTGTITKVFLAPGGKSILVQVNGTSKQLQWVQGTFFLGMTKNGQVFEQQGSRCLSTTLAQADVKVGQHIQAQLAVPPIIVTTNPGGLTAEKLVLFASGS